jgi:hypothetical protein
MLTLLLIYRAKNGLRRMLRQMCACGLVVALALIFCLQDHIVFDWSVVFGLILSGIVLAPFAWTAWRIVKLILTD